MTEITASANRLRTCNRQPPEVWAEIRAAYEAGEEPSSLALRFAVGKATIFLRRRDEGWSREASSSAVRLPRSRAVDALTIAEAALNAALTALRQGRPAEAMALIKAGDAIGAFADFVARLRLDARGGEPDPDARSRAASAEPAGDVAPCP